LLKNADTRPAWAQGERALFEHIGGAAPFTGYAAATGAASGPAAALCNERPPWTPPAAHGSARFRRLFAWHWRACGKILSCTSGPASSARRGAVIFIHGRRAMYQSDITQFLNQLKSQKPTLEEEQRRGRSLLWDKQPIDLDERAANQEARVKQNSYVYYQNF
jgi:hypothetical protein